MKKAIIPILVFGVSAIAGAGAGIRRARAHTAADSAHVRKDSAATADSLAGKDNSDSGVAKHDSATTTSEPLPVAPPQPASDTSRTTQPVRDSAVASRLVPTALPAVSAQQERITRVFAAMSARDAAKVLERMSDQDIMTILGGMTERRAAEVLGLLPAERSATIARSVLGPAKDGK
ncbi:MAG TPA: hypothetical protein VE967_19870 [Gemmatimonadaceae bacterium]|nr:hypothetical protein [Gemmatimonadaceae bacterium]